MNFNVWRERVEDQLCGTHLPITINKNTQRNVAITLIRHGTLETPPPPPAPVGRVGDGGGEQRASGSHGDPIIGQACPVKTHRGRLSYLIWNRLGNEQRSRLPLGNAEIMSNYPALISNNLIISVVVSKRSYHGTA